jgi:hypothetical protein
MILGIFLMIIGGFVIVIGVMNLLGYNPLIAVLGGDFTLLRIVSISAYTNIVMAGLGIVAGIFLIKSQEEWSLGIAMASLIYTIAFLLTDFIYNLQLLLSNPVSALTSISLWLTMTVMTLAIIAIVFFVIMEWKLNHFD